MDVLDICMSLVSVVITDVPYLSELNRRSSTTVTLAHYSVQEYLVSVRICQGRAARYSMQPAACHGSIAKGCIGYLLQYEKGLLDRFDSARSVRNVYALAQYSVEHWVIHTRKAEEDDNRLSYLATKFLSTGEGAYLNWLRLYDPDNAWATPNFRRELDSCPNPLWGQRRRQRARRSLRQRAPGSISWRPRQGTRVLIHFGDSADVNAQGGAYGNALQAASDGGHDKVVEVLLSKGAVQELGN
ncbi:hypothetical protein V502_01035 [Pseudogymnoascus sp. VKM F-4520 (FW-2644)]|nr:hypothetical protein V502_01035 [Pseudogymnoascus sp. VKM F-4520 (FW-2644)]